MMTHKISAPLLLIAALLLAPVLLAGQGYPKTFYLTGLVRTASGGEFGGPDWAMTDTYGYTCSPYSPLLVTEINHHHQGWMDGCEPSNYNENLPFPGALTLSPDHYVIKYPLTLEPNIDPAHVRKMDYQGYCLENDWYGYGTAHYHAWHYYNEDMKVIRTVMKNLSPLQWWESSFTLDGVGRRLEELTRCSSDSLYWINSRSNQYFYTGEQFAPGYEFEKHSLYLNTPNQFWTVFYMNDLWIISHLIRQTADSAGDWYPPETWTYNCQVQDGMVTVHNLWGYNTFNAKGLLTSVNIPGGDGVPSYQFFYAETSGTSIQEELLPPVQSLRIWPNPVRREATLLFPEKAVGTVTLSTYNIRGQLVKEELRELKAADFSACWQALDTQGKALENGVYLIKASGSGYFQTARIVVAK